MPDPFAVAIAGLIILGIIAAFRTRRHEERHEEEPTGEDWLWPTR